VPLSELRAFLVAPDRTRGLLTIATSSLVIFLAAIRFYGTQRYLVAAGRREYAIRASLGAGPRSLGRLVLRRSLSLSLPGIFFGGLLSFVVVAWMREDYLSRDVSPGAVSVYVVAGLAVLVLLATTGPAQEARQTQPASLLRED
jgi:ABC-type antimicrobial peptide transport system permease subunit